MLQAEASGTAGMGRAASPSVAGYALPVCVLVTSQKRSKLVFRLLFDLEFVWNIRNGSEFY